MNDAKVMPNVEKIVLAGMKLFYSKETANLRDALLSSKGDVIERIASNVTGLMQLLWDKSQGKLPPDAIVPATVMLEYEIASFMKEAGVQVSTDDMSQAVPLSLQMIKELFTQILSKRGNAPTEAAAQPAKPQAQPPQQPPQGLLAQGAA